MLYTDFVTRMASLHYSPRKVSGPRAVSTQRCDRECFFSNFLHLGNFACLRACLRLFVTLVHYLQFILVIERMKHRPFSILLNFSRVWHLTRSHSRLYTGKVARLVCGWVAERCGEARLETEAHVLLRPARTPRIDAKLRLLNESLQSSLIHSMDSRRKSSYR